jgi:hypothetical protein
MLHLCPNFTRECDWDAGTPSNFAGRINQLGEGMREKYASLLL